MIDEMAYKQERSSFSSPTDNEWIRFEWMYEMKWNEFDSTSQWVDVFFAVIQNIGKFASFLAEIFGEVISIKFFGNRTTDLKYFGS